jgi:hypothetical protein
MFMATSSCLAFRPASSRFSTSSAPDNDNEEEEDDEDGKCTDEDEEEEDEDKDEDVAGKPHATAHSVMEGAARYPSPFIMLLDCDFAVGKCGGGSAPVALAKRGAS